LKPSRVGKPFNLHNVLSDSDPIILGITTEELAAHLARLAYKHSIFDVNELFCSLHEADFLKPK